MTKNDNQITKINLLQKPNIVNVLKGRHSGDPNPELALPLLGLLWTYPLIFEIDVLSCVVAQAPSHPSLGQAS